MEIVMGCRFLGVIRGGGTGGAELSGILLKICDGTHTQKKLQLMLWFRSITI